MSSADEKMKKSLEKIKDAVIEFQMVGDMSVDVGLPSDRIHEPSGLPLAQLGAMHEFGFENIPERSFLRSALILRRNEIKEAMTIVAKKSADGENPQVLMEQLALFGQGQVQENLVELTDPPLKRKRKDGSDNPLNDTGALKQGIIGVVVSD